MIELGWVFETTIIETGEWEMRSRFQVARFAGLAWVAIIAGGFGAVTAAEVYHPGAPVTPKDAPPNHPIMNYTPPASTDQRISQLEQEVNVLRDQVDALQQKIAAYPSPQSILTTGSIGGNKVCAFFSINPNDIIKKSRANIVAVMGQPDLWPDGINMISYGGCH